MNIKECLSVITAQLKENNIDTPAQEAGVLLCHALKCDRTYLYAHPEEELDEPIVEQLFDYVIKRINKIPLQYIVGNTEFMSLTFSVTPSVLIPRQDTELLVETCINLANKGVAGAGPRSPRQISILDMCTGSGCIAVSLAWYLGQARLTACDITDAALEVARVNAKNNGVAERITFLQGDLFDALIGLEQVIPSSVDMSEAQAEQTQHMQEHKAQDEQIETQHMHVEEAQAQQVQQAQSFDIIASNPPYIESETISTLDPEVRSNEPLLALDGGTDGLDFYRRISKESSAYLKQGGYLVLEIGYNQGQTVSSLLTEAGFTNVSVLKDLCNNDRVVLGQKL